MGGLEPEVDLVLTVRAKGYQPGELSIEPLNFDELRDDLDVVLRVGSDLKVSVLDAAGNPGAFGSLALDPLEIEGDPESRRESFQEGSTLVSGLAPGLWKVTATLFAMPRPGDSGPPKREEQTQEVLVLEGQPAQLEFQF